MKLIMALFCLSFTAIADDFCDGFTKGLNTILKEKEEICTIPDCPPHSYGVGKEVQNMGMKIGITSGFDMPKP